VPAVIGIAVGVLGIIVTVVLYMRQGARVRTRFGVAVVDPTDTVRFKLVGSPRVHVGHPETDAIPLWEAPRVIPPQQK
jgi:hypothetical protein